MILEKDRGENLKGSEGLSRSEILDELAMFALGGSESVYQCRISAPCESDASVFFHSDGDDNSMVNQDLGKASRCTAKIAA